MLNLTLRKKSIILLIFILAIGAFMRFYKIREYLTFLGDEGRDVLVVKRMLIDGKFTLLGPITSVGSIYMGPAYYYMTAPFLYLWRFDPVGPAIMVASLAIVTIYLIYRIGSDYFHPVVGLVAAFTYSISRLAVVYGHSSWNPNVVPFFSVLLIFSVLKTIIEHRFKFLLLAGLSLGILLQLHYVTLMFLPILLAVFIFIRPQIPPKYTIFAFAAFLLAYSPFILFEFRHQFVNLRGVWTFLITNNQSAPGIYLYSWGETLKDVVVRVFWRPLIVQSAEITKLFMVFITVVAFFSLKDILKKKESKIAFTVLLLWLVLGLLSFGFYRGAIYDYYFGSLFAVPHLIFGLIFYLLWQKGKLFRILGAGILALIVVFNIIHSPLSIEPNNMLKNTKEIAEFVIGKTQNQPYNFALIADKNSDHAYRYFLEVEGFRPVVIENPQIDPSRQTVTSQLLVVCEEKVCQPEGHPLWEIAGFGQAQIEGSWPVSTVKVFRLIKYSGEKNGQ